jgi:hypothetical protein
MKSLLIAVFSLAVGLSAGWLMGRSGDGVGTAEQGGGARGEADARRESSDPLVAASKSGTPAAQPVPAPGHQNEPPQPPPPVVAAPAVPHTSEEWARQLIDSAPLGEVQDTGQITVVVRTTAGEPVPGVQVQAALCPRDLSGETHEGTNDGLGLERMVDRRGRAVQNLAAAIVAATEAVQGTHLVTTDGSGTAVIGSLPKTRSYNLSAALAGRTLAVAAGHDAVEVPVGRRVAFIATAAAALEIRVVKADGTAVEKANIWVEASTPYFNPPSDVITWHRGDPAWTLPAGKAYVLQATAEIDGVDCRSPEVRVEAGQSDKPIRVTLTLAAPCGLRGTVTFGPSPVKRDCTVTLASKQRNPDPGARPDEPAWSNETTVASTGGKDSFTFDSLVPGEYELMLEESGQPTVKRDVTVTAGVSQITLAAPLFDDSKHLRVRLQTPGNVPLRDAEVIAHAYRQGENSPEHVHNSHAALGSDGAWWLLLADEFWDVEKALPPFLEVGAWDYARERLPLDRHLRGEITVQLREPRKLTVHLDGPDDEDCDDFHCQIAPAAFPQCTEGMYFDSKTRECHFGGLAPGDYTLRLRLTWSGLFESTCTVTVGSGDVSVTLTAPPIFVLKVRANAPYSLSDAKLVPTGKAAASALDCNWQNKGEATWRKLLRGVYTVTLADLPGAPKMTVTVDRDTEVTFTPDP